MSEMSSILSYTTQVYVIG